MVRSKSSPSRKASFWLRKVLAVVPGVAIVTVLVVAMLWPRAAILVESFDNLPPGTPPFEKASIYQKGFFQRSAKVTGKIPPDVKRLHLFIKGKTIQWILHKSIALSPQEKTFTIDIPQVISGWELMPPVIAVVLMGIGGNLESNGQIDTGTHLTSLPQSPVYSHTFIIKPFPPILTLLNWRKYIAMKLDLKPLSTGVQAVGSDSINVSRWRVGESLISGRSGYSSSVCILVKEGDNAWVVINKAIPDPFTGEFQGWWHHGIRSNRTLIVAITGAAAERYRKGEEIHVLPDTSPRSPTLIIGKK